MSDREGVAEDTYLMRFTMASGVEGVLMQTGGAWGQPAAMNRVAGTHGTLWMENGAVWLADKTGTRQLPIPEELALPYELPSDDPAKPYLHIELPPAKRLCEIWREAIAGKSTETAPAATFADGLACMEVIDAIRASAAGDGAVVQVG